MKLIGPLLTLFLTSALAQNMVDKINIRDDPRIERHSADVNGKTYEYILALPEGGEFNKTVFLIHGFPDISATWRHQIPVLLELGLRVVAPDGLGYGRTDAPDSADEYTFKKMADDIKELARQLEAPQIVLGGHDWGGALVYRTALYHPELISHLFSICTPYSPPAPKYVDLETLVKYAAPNFGYQLQFVNEPVEERFQSKEEIRQFLLALYGGKNEAGEAAFDVTKGILFDKIGNLQGNQLLTDDELNFYVEEFSRHGLHGPFNWYRTREQNFNDELSILDRTNITQPTLYIGATRDKGLPPVMSTGMEKFIPKLTRGEVDADHWAQWQRPAEVSELVKKWIEGVVLGGKALL